MRCFWMFALVGVAIMAVGDAAFLAGQDLAHHAGAFQTVDVGNFVQGVLANDTWTRVLMIGAIVWGIFEIRSIRRTMVTTTGLELINAKMAEEIRHWADQTFLPRREADLAATIVDLRERIDRRQGS